MPTHCHVPGTLRAMLGYARWHVARITRAYRCISLFFIIMLLIARLSFVANSPLNAVFIFILSCLSTVSRTRSSTTSPASFKNRHGSMWLEFITAPVNIRLSNAVSISRHRSPYPVLTCTNRPRTESFKLSSLVIHVITDCLLPNDNRERLAWLCSSRNSMSSSHRCSHATYSSLVFSWVACSIKSRSMLSLALTNDRCV